MNTAKETMRVIKVALDSSLYPATIFPSPKRPRQDSARGLRARKSVQTGCLLGGGVLA
jgi:hypothetical protein